MHDRLSLPSRSAAGAVRPGFAAEAPDSVIEAWIGASLLLGPVVDPVLLLLDPEGRIAAASAPFAGMPPEAVLGLPFTDFVEPSPRVAAAVHHATSPGLRHALDLAVSRNGRRRWYAATFAPARARDEAWGALVVATEVTERRSEEERLRRSERLMIDTEETAHLGTWEWDPREPEAKWSRSLYRIYGLDPATHVPSYQDYLRRVHPDDRERVARATERVFRDFEPYSHDERVYRADGELRHLHTWAQAVLDDEGRLQRLVGVCQDITDTKRAEEQLMRSLAEKEVLLREVHHRVKNNLQVIMSLLRLEAERIADPRARDAFETSRARVRLMARAHEALYERQELASVDFGAYVARLAVDLMRAYAVDPDRIGLDVDVEPGVELDVDEAITCGLIVSELVSNSIKHGFAGDRGGTVTISLASDEGGRTLAVRDDGAGLPAEFDPAATGTLGLQLVLTLAEQLGGSLSASGEGGAEFRIRLPRKEAPA